MKNKIISFILLVFAFMMPVMVSAKEEYVDKIYDIVGEKESTKVTVYLFHSDSCPHCKAERKLLDSLSKKYDFDIRKYEVSNKDNSSYMKEAKKRMDSSSTGVPFTVIGEHYYEGYSSGVGTRIENTIKAYLGEEIKEESPFLEEEKGEETTDLETEYELPLMGKIDAKKVSIPLVAVVLGLVDGFNPCAMWILLFLINMLLNMKSRKKMWLIGFTFLFTSAFVYFLAMLGLSIALSFVQVKWVQRIIAVVAIIGGIVNLKSYIETPKDGCQVVDDKKRKKYFKQIKSFTSEQNLLIALAGVILLAVSVNMVELACSAGFPTIFVTILDLNNISILSKIGYILIYILFYLLDDLIVFIVAMLTLKVSGLTTKYNRLSHLIGGIIMIIIGLLLIIKPEWIMLNF